MMKIKTDLTEKTYKTFSLKDFGPNPVLWLNPSFFSPVRGPLSCIFELFPCFSTTSKTWNDLLRVSLSLSESCQSLIRLVRCAEAGNIKTGQWVMRYGVEDLWFRLTQIDWGLGVFPSWFRSDNLGLETELFLKPRLSKRVLSQTKCSDVLGAE